LIIQSNIAQYANLQDKIKAIAEERNISQKDAAILWAEQTLIN
jgi:hypothetical protein